MTDLIAHLDMYSWPENVQIWDEFWENLRVRLNQAGIDAPKNLSRGGDPWAFWKDPDLLLGHTCGWPYVSRLREKVGLVGTFDFGLEGCPPGFYRSVFIGPKGSRAEEDLTREVILEGDRRIAVNGIDSQSGFRAFWSVLRQEPAHCLKKERLILTGSHRNSIVSIAEGKADLAAIDEVTWHLARQFEPASEEIEVIAFSNPVPGLPLITAQCAEQMTKILNKITKLAIEDCGLVLSENLSVKQLVNISDKTYQRYLVDRNV